MIWAQWILLILNVLHILLYPLVIKEQTTIRFTYAGFIMRIVMAMLLLLAGAFSGILGWPS